MKRFLIFLAMLTFIFTSCKHKQERYTDLKPITIGAMSSMDYLPFVVAQKKGIYEELGLEVKIIKFFSANDRDAAFQSGNIDGTVIDFTGAALQHSKGVNLAIVMRNDGYFHLITGKKSGIETLQQLKGKNIAVSRNTVIEYSTDRMLMEGGVLLQEVNKPEINKIPLRFEMLRNGQIDASVFPDPFAAMTINEGNKSLITTRDLGISVTGTVFSRKALTDKRKEIEVLINGYNEAVKFIRKNPRSEWREILIKDAGVPADMAETITLPDYQPAFMPAKKDIKNSIDWLKSKNLIPAGYTGAYLIDTIPGVKYNR